MGAGLGQKYDAKPRESGRDLVGWNELETMGVNIPHCFQICFKWVLAGSDIERGRCSFAENLLPNRINFGVTT
jgi:hypothetical protein